MKKKMTPAAVNKQIKKIKAEKDYLLAVESQACVYYEESTNNNIVIPEYDFVKMNTMISELDEKIAKLRHAVNFFNTHTKLRDSEYTLDEALVRMAQLNLQKDKLDKMRKRLPRQKSEDRFRNISYVEYVCANYDIELAKQEYEVVDEAIADLQMKIDYINQTEMIEVDI